MLQSLVNKVTLEPLIMATPPRKLSHSEEHKRRTEAHAEYHQTYRKLLHHAEILGDRRELRTAMKSGRAAAIFNGTTETLKELGAITPRPKSPIKREDSEATISPSFITGTDDDLNTVRSCKTINSDFSELLNSAGKSVSSLRDTTLSDEEEDSMGYNPESPRTIFLAGCVQQRIPPRSIAMLRKRFSPKLNLAHMSIGNNIAHLLAEALVKMPFLQVLNLADNNLDDSGLQAIVRAASIHGSLEVLDISHNVVDGKTADALASYIGDSRCQLKTLRMSSAGIDDRECSKFVEVLMKNRNLTELDLSKNLLGKDENLNVVKPDFVTGGESIAALLRESTCPLSTLVLHWNMIRLEGAEVLCDSLRGNKFLTHLDLSYNALGSNASCILGEALMENNTIKHLNLANNSIDAVAAMTLSISLRENWSLREVILDGNPIGEQGVRALMKVVAQEGHRVALRTLNCDMVCKSNTKLRLDNPVGDYYLNMTRSSERAIAFELLNIIANDMNFELSICDLHMVDQPGKFISTSTSTLAPTAKEGGTVDQLKFAVEELGLPTYSYSVVRFDEEKPREHMSVDEIEEEKFLQVLIPLTNLTNKAIVWEVRKYEIPHTHNFLATSLPELLNDLLLHQKLSDDSPYKMLREKARLKSIDLSSKILNGKPTEDNGNDEDDDREESGEHIDLDSAVLSMDTMLASLADDCQKLLDPQLSGLIDVDAFVDYLTQRAKVARVRLHQLRHTCRCAVRERSSTGAGNGIPKTPQVGQRSRPGTAASMILLRYIPPHSGWLHMKLIESFDIGGGKNNYFCRLDEEGEDNEDEVNDATAERPGGYTLSKSKCVRLVEEMKKANKSQPLTLLMFALESTWLRLEEAKTIYTFARSRADDPTVLLSAIITRMINSADARRMVQFAVGDDILKLRRLKQRLGSAYYPLLGVYTGYYNLDLSNPIDRKCLKSLIEKSVKDQGYRRKNGLWDTSQHGQWSSFRNEHYHRSRSTGNGGRNNAMPDINNDGSEEYDVGNSLDDDSSVVTFSANSVVTSVVSGNQANSSSSSSSSSLAKGPGVVITPNNFVPIPEKGRIEFDFVNLHRPEDIAHRRAVHETVIVDVMLLSHLLEEDEVEWAFARLHDHSKACRRSMLPLGNPSYQPTLGRAYSIANALTRMYASVPQRQKIRRDIFNRESASRVQQQTISRAATAASGTTRNRRTPQQRQPSININEVATKLQECAAEKKMSLLVDGLVETAHEQDMPVETMLHQAAEVLGTTNILKNKRHEPQNSRSIRFRSFLHQGNRGAIKVSQWGHRMQQILFGGQGTNSSDEFKASAVVEYFEAELGSYWLECRYLAVILEVFGALGVAMRSGMGSYRVELIVMLFDRIMDMHNFDLILAELSSEEHAAVLARIGILNVFNPAKCEGGWALNLSRWEERQLVKILVHMSLAEPGQNWLNQVFALYRDSEPVPAWQLNRVWFNEEGLPKKGVISFEMFAGQGLRVGNCVVDIPLRHMLSALCFPAQRDFASELSTVVQHPLVKEANPSVDDDGEAEDYSGLSWAARRDRMAEQRTCNSLFEYHGIFLHMLNMPESQHNSIPKDLLYRSLSDPNSQSPNMKAVSETKSNRQTPRTPRTPRTQPTADTPAALQLQRSPSWLNSPSLRTTHSPAQQTPPPHHNTHHIANPNYNSDRPAFNLRSLSSASLSSQNLLRTNSSHALHPCPHSPGHSASPGSSKKDPVNKVHQEIGQHQVIQRDDLATRFPPMVRYTLEDVHEHLRSTTDINWTFSSCNRKPASWMEGNIAHFQ